MACGAGEEGADADGEGVGDGQAVGDARCGGVFRVGGEGEWVEVGGSGWLDGVIFFFFFFFFGRGVWDRDGMGWVGLAWVRVSEGFFGALGAAACDRWIDVIPCDGLFGEREGGDLGLLALSLCISRYLWVQGGYGSFGWMRVWVSNKRGGCWALAGDLLDLSLGPCGVRGWLWMEAGFRRRG